MRFKTRPSLIVRLRNCADETAWREFVDSYRSFIRGVASRAGAPRQSLADVTQDVLLTVVRVLPRFTYDPDRGRFRSWLARVVRSRCRDVQRRQRREGVAHAGLCAERAPVASASGSEDRDASVLHDALRIIRESTRPATWQCFQLHAIEGRRAAEVASELETTENAVYLNCTRLTRRVEQECRRLTEQERAHEVDAMSR